MGHLAAALAKRRHSAALLTALEADETDLAILKAKRAGTTPIAVELPADLSRVYCEKGAARWLTRAQ